jgi:hypothetical protein
MQSSINSYQKKQAAHWPLYRKQRLAMQAGLLCANLCSKASFLYTSAPICIKNGVFYTGAGPWTPSPFCALRVLAPHPF